MVVEVSLYLNRKTGKWSIRSHIKMPLLMSVIIGIEVKILSISVAELFVILVGLLITGKRDCVKLRSMNSLVGMWVSELKRLRL